MNSAEQKIIDAFRVFFTEGQAVGSYIAGHLQAGSAQPVGLKQAASGQDSLTYADGGAEAAEAAVAAAREGQARWWAMTHAQRGRLMFAVGQRVRSSAEQLARLESVSSGKPIRDCRGEAMKVAEMFEYYAGWTDKLHGEVIPVPTSHLNYTRREPIGVVLQVTPWNAPLFTAGWQIAPAIAMGNAVVLKPSELTPFTSLALARLAEEAGIPTGVINVLAGYGHSMVSCPGHRADRQTGLRRLCADRRQGRRGGGPPSGAVRAGAGRQVGQYRLRRCRSRPRRARCPGGDLRRSGAELRGRLAPAGGAQHP